MGKVCLQVWVKIVDVRVEYGMLKISCSMKVGGDDNCMLLRPFACFCSCPDCLALDEVSDSCQKATGAYFWTGCVSSGWQGSGS